MFRTLITYGNTFCAVEHTNKDNLEVFNFLKLKKEKKELKITHKKQLNSFENVFTQLKKQQHLFLIINNQHVLFKKIIGVFNSEELIVKNAFPTIKISDFYYQIISNSDSHFVTICRKTYINSIVDQYKTKNYSVVGFSLHNIAVTTLSSFIVDEFISTSNAKISLKNKSIVDIQSNKISKKNYNINNLSITSDYILSLAGILSYYLKNNLKGNHQSYQNSLLQLYFNKRFYHLGLRTGLAVLFFTLLVNFIVFSSLHNKSGSLNNEILLKSSQKNALLNIKNRVDKKTKLVNSIYALSDAKTSTVINYIGESVPHQIQLTRLEFQPIKNSIKEQKEIEVLKNKINVKGISKNNHSFTKWISDLELEKWVDNIVVHNYGKGKSSLASFEFQITTKD
jgi:hypothetical protein